MTDLLAFASEHWFVALLMFVVAAQTVFLVVNRLLRTIKVVCRGWPPQHLDADGDWRPVENPKEKP